MSMLNDREKKETLLQDQSLRDQKTGTTFRDLSSLANLRAGRRFTAGLGELHRQQPASCSIWANDPKEPPLGFDINSMEPVGTAAEIEASRRQK